MTDANPHHSLWSSDDHDAVAPEPSQHRARASSDATIPGNAFDLEPQTEPLLHISESGFPAPREETIQLTSGFESYRIRTSSSRGRRRQSSLLEIIVQKRLRLLRMMKYALETLIGIWGIYNCIRYLYSYSKFSSSQGQAVALALSISSSLSFAFLGCAMLLSAFKLPLARNVPPRASHVIRKVLRPISTSLILAPAILNVIFLCIWRDSDILELSYKYRCYIDIDVIWSITGRQCVAPAWSIWLILAVVRLAVTLVAIVSYHIFSYAYGRTIRLSITRKQTLGLYETTEISSARTAHILTKEVPRNRNSQSQHRPSRSTLDSNVESIHTVIPYYSTSPRNRVAHSSSSASSDDETMVRHPPGLGASTEENADNWGDEHFRTVVSQINQEMDNGIKTARSLDEDLNDTPSPLESPYGFNLPSLPQTVGYNEFGQPYPPEEPLPILNGYIRRMPTIESMGSREMGSLASTMSMNREPRTTGSARSTLTFDRPPTRPLSFSEVTSSGTSSRPNSFGLRAELIASLGGVTELGELFDNKGRREEEDKSGPTSDQNHLDISNNPSASRSTSTYYTATSRSLGPAGDSVS